MQNDFIARNMKGTSAMDSPRRDGKGKSREMPVRKNESIRTRNVRLISEDGSSRIMANEAAQKLAKSKNLDLVEVSFQRMPDGEPVSCVKILDYNKFVYQKKQAEKQAKKLARENTVDTRELTFHLTCDDADKTRKLEKAKEFIAEGDKVKLTIQLKGRERSQKDLTQKMMLGMISYVGSVAVIDYGPIYGGRDVFVVLRPSKK